MKSSERLFIELRKNARLRIGLWVIAMIVVGYIIMLLNDYSTQLQQTYYETLARLNQLQTVANQTNWMVRREQVQKQLTQLKARFWQADTKGLAQATFQKWLNTEVTKANIENARLQVESTLDVPHNTQLWQVTAKLDATFSPETLETLLAALSKNPQLVITERLQIFYQRNPRVSLIITAYFQPLIAS
ncbi:MAG: hypothetical protein BWK79_18385 [Beggiatoa sp. IS2]|nr:MAG: hypothetical protein BWK79_18385 [Beggiatoa sp. IS2]